MTTQALIVENVSAAAATARERVELVAGGDRFEVVQLDGCEAVSELFRFEVLCRSQDDGPTPAALLGRSAVIGLRDGFGLERRIHGLVAAASREQSDQGTADLRLSIAPAVHLSTLGRDSRVFVDLDVREIVDRVLERTKAPRRWELAQRYRTRVYTAQYREDDWSFVSRLLEEEGIHYWFDHEDDASTLVLADDSRSAPEPLGGALVDYRVDLGLVGERELVLELGSEATATSTKFTVASFDPWNPALAVSATEGDGIHELYDAPGGGPESPAVCRARARVRREAAEAARHGVRGVTSSVRVVPGMQLAVAGHPRLDGRYFVTETRYQARQRRRGAGTVEDGYHCSFRCIPLATPYRPLEDTPPARQAGLQSGRIVGPGGEEIHTDERGRVRTQLHWDREGRWDDKAGKWLRVAQRGVASSMLYPRVGWNVMTFMEEGNVDAPTVLSRVHDAAHPPSYELPGNKSRTVLKTDTSPGGGSSNEIRFEDLAGLQEMFLNASKDMSFDVLDSKSAVISHDQRRSIGNRQSLSVKNQLCESVHHDQTVNVGGDEKIDITDNRQKDVGGDETAQIGGNRKVKAGAGTSLAVEKSRKLEVGGNVQEQCEGLISLRAGETSIEVGGSLVRQSDKSVSENAGDVVDEDIAGSKTEKAGTDRMLEVSKTLEEHITGNLTMTSGDRFLDGADGQSRWQVSGAIQSDAPRLHIEAKADGGKIELVCGASSITIDRDQVLVQSPAYELGDAAELVKQSAITKHN